MKKASFPKYQIFPTIFFNNFVVIGQKWGLTKISELEMGRSNKGEYCELFLLLRSKRLGKIV